MTPFELAERFIQLRKQCVPISIAEKISRISDMIVMPMIAIVLMFLKKHDIFMIVSTVTKAYSSWRDWFEYTDLRFAVQRMYLHTATVGGPFIVTNDPTYMPYVFADAVYRVPSGMGNPEGGKLLG